MSSLNLLSWLQIQMYSAELSMVNHEFHPKTLDSQLVETAPVGPAARGIAELRHGVHAATAVLWRW